MTILIHLLLVIIGLAVVIFGANFLIDGASAFAKKYNIPNIVIGLTIVSFGTSAPELVVSLYSGYTGNGDIALGNIVGSNIANIMLILGVTAMIVPLKILRNTVSKEIPLSLLAAVILYFLINDKLYGASTIDIISLSDGIVLLGFFVIFMYYMVHLTKNSQEEEALDIKNWSKAKSLMIATGGLGALVYQNWLQV